MKGLDQIRRLATRAAIRADQRRNGHAPTSGADLAEWARRHLEGTRLVIVSNREPYSHVPGPDGIRSVWNAGGLTVALDALARAMGGVWVAHGNGAADREVVDEHDHVPCPPGRPRYNLRRVWLSPEDHDHYYAGFSNSALWPLCHIAYVRPRFEREDWESYRDVNRRFAEATLEEVGSGPALVFLQDYHLALAAKYLKQARPDLRVVLFWHIPWPNAEIFRRLPWREELIEGLLANDMIGFHIHLHAINFLGTVADTLETRVDREHRAVEREGHRTWVRHFPMGVDVAEIATMAEMPETRAAEERLRSELKLGDARLGLGVDRLDYTKGLPERLRGLERFYEKYPDWVGRFRFLQVGVPSRIELEEYRAVRTQTHEAIERINQRFGTPDTPAVHLIEESLDFRDLLPLYRAADLCAVTSLHDGMNLVAKEYIAASPDGQGALILSPFTGAARELERAWIVSPYDREDLADVFLAALTEAPEARRARMADLADVTRRRTIFDWAIDVLEGARSLAELPPTRDTQRKRITRRSAAKPESRKARSR